MKHLRSLGLVVVVGLVAYFAGSILGGYLVEREEESFKARRDALTEVAAAKHVQLGAGDTIPDIALETLEGDTVTLWTAIAQINEHGAVTRATGSNAANGAAFERIYLVAVHPQCGTCVEEMAEIARFEAEHRTLGPFIFVSAANPRECQDVRDSLGLENTFLYDHRGRFLYSFGLDIYPLVLSIDQDHVVRDLILGTLLPSEIAGATSNGSKL